MENIKSWISIIVSVATIVNIGFAIYLGIQTLRMNKITRKLNQQTLNQNYQLAIERKQSQANKVSLWRIGKPKGKFNQENKVAYQNHRLPVYFNIKDASTLPIYDIVVLDVSSKRTLRLNNFSQLIPHSSTDSEENHFAYSKSLAPGETSGFLYGRGSGMGETDDFCYFFHDASGNYWFRSNDGSLESVKGERAFLKYLNLTGIMQPTYQSLKTSVILTIISKINC